jgi:hypothetical protein
VFPVSSFLPVSDQIPDKMATLAVAKIQTQTQIQTQIHTQTQTQIQTQIIASVVEDLVSHACGACGEGGAFKENDTNPKKNKNVRFAEDMQTYYYDRQRETTAVMQGEDCLAKTYDGMEFAKQVTEYLVYAYFERRIITVGIMIKPVLNAKFGNLDKDVTNRVIELLANAHKRVQLLPIYSRTLGKVQLFRNTVGKHGIGFTKKHQNALRILVHLCRMLFQKNTSVN